MCTLNFWITCEFVPMKPCTQGRYPCIQFYSSVQTYHPICSHKHKSALDNYITSLTSIQSKNLYQVDYYNLQHLGMVEMWISTLLMILIPVGFSPFLTTHINISFVEHLHTLWIVYKSPAVGLYPQYSL